MEQIQQALAECGWADAALLEQQDTSEAFAFIADALQLPLLALQVDLFHHGKGDADDHKVVHERCLNLAVPPDPDGKGIKLEDCLEEYFNNKVDVLRDSVAEEKPASKSTMDSGSTIRVVPTDGEETLREETDDTQLRRRWTTPSGAVQSPAMIPSRHPTDMDALSGSRTRSTSIIQRFVVKGEGSSAAQSADPETKSLLGRAKRTGSSVVKAVTIPAWQFYRLIREFPPPRKHLFPNELELTMYTAWIATSDSAPNSNVELARHFDQRPIVAICLKRYTMTPQGIPMRQNTLIDIPDSLRLPHFMVVDDHDPKAEEQDSNGLRQGYRLVLQSVICHRGDSLHSGHYVAYARVAPKLMTDNRRYEHDPPPDYEEPQWVRFDDLAIEKRVETVDDIQQCLRRQEEMPYVLIYQIVPMVDVTTTSSEQSVTRPPSYIESARTVPGTPSVETASERTGRISKSTSGYFDSGTTLVQAGRHLRPSTEFERPPRLSYDEGPSFLSRPASIAFSEPLAAPSMPASPVAVSPAVTPQEETTATRLSRAAAVFKAGANRSRPTSQAGEGRISLTMSRFGFGRQNRDNANGANGVPDSEVSADDQAGLADSEDAGGKQKEKEHHTPRHRHRQKKDRSKSKSRDREAKRKGKGKDLGKESDKEGGADRECVVM
jgi:hypothetical protein